MKWCARCVTPDTRPNVSIGSDGVCNACEAGEIKKVIDWAERERSFRAVADRARSRRSDYDCIVPVSGGKDSHWQVVRCLEYGLHPLCITWKAPCRTAVGEENLQNLIELGVDHIDFRINPRAERKFLLRALDRFGSTAIPMHMAIFNVPMRLAVQLGIPLVVWGENSAFEYGGTEDERMGFALDSRWLEKYGATHGTSWRDWVDDDLTEADLAGYKGPDDAELRERGVNAVFLGYYFPWDPAESLRVAEEHGFKHADAPKTGLYDFADIDDEFISLHHFLKWYKFGFTRLFDNLSLEIRNGRLGRDEAIQIIRESGDQTPRDDIASFCRYVGIRDAEFFERIEKFRSPAVWKLADGVWQIPEFLITKLEVDVTSAPTGSCLCGSKGFEEVFHYDAAPEGEIAFRFAAESAYRRDVLRCSACGHFISTHEMDQGDLYAGDYVTATYGDASDLRRTFDRITSLPPEASDNVARVKRIVRFAAELWKENAPQAPSILDVGSGLCVFLHRMLEKGWVGTALDPDERAAEHAREVAGINAHCGDFMDFDLVHQFDAISFNKVLEHVLDPVSMLARAASMIRPGGFCYVELPDGTSAAREGKHREEFFIDHPHIFSAMSFMILAKRSGFEMQALERLREPSTKYTLRGFLTPRGGGSR